MSVIPIDLNTYELLKQSADSWVWPGFLPLRSAPSSGRVFHTDSLGPGKRTLPSLPGRYLCRLGNSRPSLAMGLGLGWDWLRMLTWRGNIYMWHTAQMCPNYLQNLGCLQLCPRAPEAHGEGKEMKEMMEQWEDAWPLPWSSSLFCGSLTVCRPEADNW